MTFAGRRGAAALALGAMLNLPGVLVAPGAWLSYVERLVPPDGAAWPERGGERISEIAALSPLYGHPWLLARSAGLDLPAPWLAQGAREGTKPPTASGYLSPRALRAVLGLPQVRPIVPNLLYNTAVAALRRGFPDLVRPYAAAALLIDPGHRPAADLVRQIDLLGARVPRPGDGE